jgi:hypothetical protein
MKQTLFGIYTTVPKKPVGPARFSAEIRIGDLEVFSVATTANIHPAISVMLLFSNADIDQHNTVLTPPRHITSLLIKTRIKHSMF